MLHHLRFQNFKGWQDTGPIRMAPITLFFGVNSSGKSSIGQFLMMLKQTAETPDRKAVFYPGGRNSAVQLGTYHDILFQQDLTRKIAFEYGWHLSELLAIKDPVSNETYTGDRLGFEATVGLEDKGQYAWALERFHYRLRNDAPRDVMEIGMAHHARPKEAFEVEALGYALKPKQARPWHPASAVRFYGFPDEVVAHYQNAEFVQELNLRHENLFRSMFYLGPLRTKPERLYSWTGVEPESVGYAGENTVAAILAAKRRKISLGPKKHAKGFEEIIAEKLLQMELIDEFKIDSISKHRQDYEVKVRTKGSRYWVDLPDVGFGVSQVLPVLTQCFYALHDSIIIVEQPELHLHPRAQSALADVLIDVIHAREEGRDRRIQLIIETHSEHFLRRLQRRIAEGELPQNDVAAYFANASQAPARLDPLQIDEYGNIRNWPPHFFGEEMLDIIEQGKAAVKKRLADLKRGERHDEG